MALEREIETYQRLLPELAATSEGKYVVIHGEEVAGFADDFEGPLEIGYDNFEPGTFQMKQVWLVELPVILPFWVVGPRSHRPSGEEETQG